jgi:hypothetical protein
MRTFWGTKENAWWMTPVLVWTYPMASAFPGWYVVGMAVALAVVEGMRKAS